MTPEDRERMDILVEEILGNPKLCHMIQHSFMKARFEKINCRYLGLCGDECSCQR